MNGGIVRVDDSHLRVVEGVQKRLIELGYVTFGPADGFFGQKTQAAVLDFRNRNKLPLVATIDDQLITALATAEKIILPDEQITATTAEIAPKVEAVEKTVSIWFTSRWTKIAGWFAGIFSLFLSFIKTVVEQFDAALAIIMPVKNAFDQIPVAVWLAAFGGIVIVFALLAGKTQGDAAKVEEKLVDGYRGGQVNNDTDKNLAAMEHGDA